MRFARARVVYGAMLDIRVIPVATLLATGRALSLAHWRESEPHIAAEHAPDADTYSALESAGHLICLGAYSDGALVGYATAVVSGHLHYGAPYAYSDLLYLDPEARKGPAGLMLMRALADAARERGAKWVAWAAKPGSNLDRLLGQSGHPIEDIIYREDL